MLRSSETVRDIYKGMDELPDDFLALQTARSREKRDYHRRSAPQHSGRGPGDASSGQVNHFAVGWA